MTTTSDPEVPYDQRFPIGVQTVVEDRIINGQMTYQVNTRSPNGWHIIKTTKATGVAGVLRDHAEQFKEKYDISVDTRYVKNLLRSF